LLLLLMSCDGGARTSTTPRLVSAELGAPVLLGASIGGERVVSGLPHGIRVSWARVNDPTAVSYYLYRDSQPILGNPPDNTALRVNGGAEILQVPDDPVTFDDGEFLGGHPVVGETYHYRVTVVNDTGDESDFSNEITYTVTGHSVTSFVPPGGAYGDQVTLTCAQIYDFDDAIDSVEFPSRDGMIEAEIVSWDGAMNEIVVTVPDLAVTGQIRVIVNGLAAVPQDDFYITSPYVLEIDHTHAAEGEQVMISGENLGDSQGDSVVAFAGEESAPILLWNDAVITAIVPPIDPLVVDTVVGITVGGKLLGEFDLELDPIITSPSSLNLNRGETAILNGRHFGVTGQLDVNGSQVIVSSWLETEIRAIVDSFWTAMSP